MDKKKSKLLILEGVDPSEDSRIGDRIERTRVMNFIPSSGAKIRHDSGGRLIVVELSEKEEKDLVKRLPGIQIIDLDSDKIKRIPDLDTTESLFVDALKMRASKKYREAKKRRKPGESPEEKELFSGSCVREEY